MAAVDLACASGTIIGVSEPFEAFLAKHDAHLAAEDAVLAPAYEALLDSSAKAKIASSDAEVSKLIIRVKDMEHAKDFANFLMSWKQLSSSMVDHITMEEALAISKIGASSNAPTLLECFKRELAKSSCATPGCAKTKGCDASHIRILGQAL